MILVIAGTRPEVIKLARVIANLEFMKLPYDFILSGQHQELATDLLDWFEIAKYRILSTEFGSSLNLNLANMLITFEKKLDPRLYRLVVTQGDTTTSLAGSMWSFFNKIPHLHIEAGLRCKSAIKPFPEEINRRLIGQLATLNFAPTKNAVSNLLSENIDAEKVILVGNTVVDALIFTREKLLKEYKPVITLDRSKRNVLITAHRRESYGEPFVRICSAVSKLANEKNIDIYWPIHPNPAVNAVIKAKVGKIKNIRLIDPLPYNEMVNLLQHIDLILTDSGGLQEEAAILNKNILVLREETERLEIIESGIGQLVGTDTAKIFDAARAILNDKKKKVGGG